MSRTPEQGDPATARFEKIFEQTRGPILGYLLRRVQHPPDAADLLGEVYLIAWRRIDDVPNGDQARLWLYAVARRVLANHFRSRTRESQLGNRLREELTIQVDSPVDHPRAEELLSYLDELSSDDRELIQLSIWEGLSATDIARVTDQSAGAVRVRLHRIRKILATRLHSAPDHRARQGATRIRTGFPVAE